MMNIDELKQIARGFKLQRSGLSKAIQREARILWQCAGGRVASRKLEQDRAFREARPEWRSCPSQPWAREIQAAQRLCKALGVRYGAA